MIKRYVLLWLAAGFALQAAEEAARHPRGNRQPIQTSRCNEVPARLFDVILSRPASRSISVSVLCYSNSQGFIAYGKNALNLEHRTPGQEFRPGEPAAILLGGLEPDMRYFYRLHLQQTTNAIQSFHTARPQNAPFSFTITADSHLDEHTNPLTYQQTLANARANKPDFHIDLGDTFMTEKHPDREAAAKQYLAQRYYFGQLCDSTPLFLVLGNHDGESPQGRGGAADDLSEWSNQMRKRYYPNPVPDGFYSGNEARHPKAGLLEDYYAWEWGDALFVVLDPFWFTQKERGGRDHWKRTLGAGQYAWLKHTLETSRSQFKCVFIHHLVGGADNQCRGGAEAASFYEWGGRNLDGSDGFQEHRPGWLAPVHQLLLQNKVTIVFHGHDHFYAKQDLDGIVYQEVPQPGYPGNGKSPRSAAEYGYKTGVLLGSSGHLRVTISAKDMKVDYIRSNQSTAHSYSIKPTRP